MVQLFKSPMSLTYRVRYFDKHIGCEDQFQYSIKLVYGLETRAEGNSIVHISKIASTLCPIL